jgi:anti-sigma regulatory factor (Ser/Thr protein kinase)
LHEGLSRLRYLRCFTKRFLVNIFNYAYKDSGLDGNVEITCMLADAQSFIIEIADSGVPFNILTVREPDVTADIDKRPIGGLGVFFCKNDSWMKYTTGVRRKKYSYPCCTKDRT